MSRTEILDKLKEIFGMVFGDEKRFESYDEDARLVEDMGLSSVGILYVVIGIEEFFNIRFEDVGFGDFKTVKDVVDYLENKA